MIPAVAHIVPFTASVAPQVGQHDVPPQVLVVMPGTDSHRLQVLAVAVDTERPPVAVFSFLPQGRAVQPQTVYRSHKHVPAGRVLPHPLPAQRTGIRPVLVCPGRPWLGGHGHLVEVIAHRGGSAHSRRPGQQTDQTRLDSLIHAAPPQNAARPSATFSGGNHRRKGRGVKNRTTSPGKAVPYPGLSPHKGSKFFLDKP